MARLGEALDEEDELVRASATEGPRRGLDPQHLSGAGRSRKGLECVYGIESKLSKYKLGSDGKCVIT